MWTEFCTINAGGVAHYPHCKSCPAMTMKKKAYTVTTMLQAMAVAENASKEAAARQFIVDARRVCGVMLTASDNFYIARE